jgi:hypothetical protein
MLCCHLSRVRCVDVDVDVDVDVNVDVDVVGVGDVNGRPPIGLFAPFL